MKKKTLIIRFLIIFIYFILMFPSGIKEMFNITRFVELFQVYLTFIILIIYIKKNKISKIFISILLYFSIIGISTILNNGSFLYFASKYVPYIAILLFTELLVENNLNNLLKSMYFLILMLFLINLLTILIYPGGMFGEDHYFLGLDNTYTITLMFGAIIMWLYCEIYNKGKVFTFLNLLIPTISLFLTNAGTGKFIFSLLIIIFIFFEYIKKFKMFNFKNYVLLSIILFLAIVVFRLQSYFSFIIVDLLGKDLTLTLRTHVWDEVLKSFKNNYIIGIGDTVGHAHSTYLNILNQSGIIGLIFYLFIMKVIYNDIKDIENNRLIKIMEMGFLLYFIMTVTEFYFENYLFYFMIILLYNGKKIIKLYEEKLV